MVRNFLRISFLLAFFLEIGTVPGFSQEVPRWPLDIPISPSSSYAEFRGMRFHGGVDLRTNKKTGYPVYAIEDGFVSRIKIQHRGFGYALYVDHPSINARAVFGHLDDFAGPVAAYAATKLKKMGKRYGIDDSFSAEKFPVRKNQIIAYTGETGLGPPHLHFEMRTFKDEPISPTTLGMEIPDAILPELFHVYFEPLSPDASMNRSFLPLQLALSHAGKGRYAWKEPVALTGKVGVELGLVDPGEGGNRFGVETIEVSLDGVKIFERAFNQYSYDENDQCPYIYDYPKTQRSGTGFVYTLFKWPFESLKFSEKYAAWSGVLSPANPGKHTLGLKVVDFGGNVVTAEGPVFIEASREQKNPYRGPLTTKRISYNTFNIVTECDFVGKPAFDSVLVSDGRGLEQVLPAFFSEKSVQVAFPIEARWAQGAKTENSQVLPALTYVDSGGGEIRSNDGARVLFPSGSLHFPVLGCLLPRPDLRGSKTLPAQSVGWELHCGSLVTGAPMKFEIPYKASCPPKRVGLFSPGGKGYSSCGGEGDGKVIRFSTRSPTPLVALEDSVPPSVKFTGVRTIKRLGPCRVYQVDDVGKGVDYESCQAFVDGQPADIDSDPDKDEVYVPIPAKGTGKHSFKVLIADHAGNTKEGN